MTLREALDRLFDRANYLNGLLHHLKVQLGAFRDSTREQVASGRAQASQFAAGSSLVVRDLTEWPSHGWAVYYSSGGFATEGEEFLALVDRLLSREAAWGVAQGFEAVESCLKDLLAAYYLEHPGAAEAAELRKQERGLRRAGHDPTRPEFWSAFVRRTYRSADDALAILRQAAPQMLDAEHRNNYSIDLVKWFAAVSEVRHAVVHSNLTISKERWSALRPDVQRLIETSFAGTHLTGGYELAPSVKQANAALVLLTEYGYAAFKALCIAGGNEWRIFHQQGTQ